MGSAVSATYRAGNKVYYGKAPFGATDKHLCEHHNVFFLFRCGECEEERNTNENGRCTGCYTNQLYEKVDVAPIWQKKAPKGEKAHSKDRREPAERLERLGAKMRNYDMCLFYLKGSCKNGDVCFFNHTEKERLEVINFKTVLCNDYASGKCPRGEKCSFAHGEKDLRKPNLPKHSTTPENYKTVLCNKEPGKCPKGSKCTYAHGAGELRPRT